MQAINLFNPIHRKQSVNQNSTFKGTTYPNLRPLACDTVSFSGMKKSEFEGFDLAIVNRFKAPISKFEEEKDFDKWCKNRVDEIKDKDYSGRQDETTIQRREMLKEWFEYVTQENDAYTSSIQLLILDSITKGLNQDNDNIPPVLNKGVLADTISQIQEGIKKDKRFEQGQINFNKMYQLNLQNYYMKDLEEVDDNCGEHRGKTGWVVIPSYDNDPEHFDENVEKLKALSHKNWCTKSFNAEPYLRDGDFHIYLDNGHPKLGVRFFHNKVQEIQGEKNNSRIPLDYLDIAISHIDKNELNLTQDAREQIFDAKDAREWVKKIKKDLKEELENKDFKSILEYLGIDVKENENGLLTISEYRQPADSFDFSDIGIDENEILKCVCEIEGNVDFSDSQATSLGSVTKIGGDAGFSTSRITDLGKLEYVGGRADFSSSKIKSLGNLKHIGDVADFRYSKVKDLGELEYIGDCVDFSCSEITDLKNLEYIGKYACIEHSKVKDLGKLKYIGGNVDFKYSKVEDLKNLEYIGGNASFIYSNVKNLGKLHTIGGGATFELTKIKDLGNLKTIGGDAIFRRSEIRDLGKLEKIGGDLLLYNSVIEDLKNLKYIGGNADFSYSNVENLGDLEIINKNAVFTWSKVKDLGKLHTIGGDAHFKHSKVRNKGDLKAIGGDAYIDNSTLHLLDNVDIKGKTVNCDE